MEQPLTLEEKKRVRFEATIDILYLMNLLGLYVGSFLSPIIGIIYAIILKSGSLSERAKRVGHICLILALIGLGIWVLFIIIIVVIAVAVGVGYGF
ncbi:MAG: hypothetical protein E3J71_09225 [Candidatus Stahlbacteria bacterium]|nr:MAG: hypothetical protein E3J71_09225 [Candidatus Stahlbacteria bacterium]